MPAPPYQYTSVERPHRPDPEMQDDSNTEASESLMGHDEKQQLWPARRSVARKVCDAVRPWRWLLDLSLLLVIVGLLLERRSKSYGYCEYEMTGEISGFAPKIKQHIKTFVPDLSFVPDDAELWFTEEVKNKWLNLVPKGLGYVKIERPEEYNNLPQRLIEYPNATVYTTSVTHQLHCLHSIVENYAAMRLNRTSTGMDDMAPWHINHCFEYLRQTIMCCGDTAIEGEATTFPEGQFGSDGWDAKHVCKDYTQIHDYLEANRANDDVWV